MAKRTINDAVGHLWACARAGTLADLPDGQLLERFANHREEAAFAALLLRHGSMVLDVCRRVLECIHDAEDVFQATFLMLARKAGSIRKRDSVGCWLHGVAYRLAVRARGQARSRQARERQAASPRRAGAALGAAWREVQAVLDEELQRLPAKYRDVLVLCYLEGQTQEEVSCHLGCPLGTVRSRLARARSLFQKRLVRRGLTVSAGALASALLARAASAAVPATPLHFTQQAALPFAAGRALGGQVSAQAVLLAEEGLKAMSAAKLKLALAATVVVAALIAGAGSLAVQARQEGAPKAVGQKPGAPLPAEEPVVRAVREVDELPAGALHRLGSPRFRHDHGGSRGSSWMPTAFSHDGKMLATCAGNIRLWEPATGRLLREIDGRSGKLPREISSRFWSNGSLAFSPDDKVLAVQGYQSIYLLDPATGKLLHQLTSESHSRFFAFSPDGKLLATTGPSNGIKAAGGNYSVSLWDTATGRQDSVLSGHGHLIHSAAFTPDGRTLVTACYGNRVCRWDVARRELRQSFDLSLPEGRTACLSPDGGTLAVAAPRTAGLGGADSLWDTETGRQRCAVPSGRGEWDYGLAFSPDGKVLATNSTEAGSDRVTVSLWNVTTAERITRFSVPAGAAFLLTFAPDGKTLLGSGPEPQVRLWDTVTGQQVLAEAGHAGAITSLSFTPDGRALVSGADDGTLRVWDVATARLRRPLPGHRRGVHALAVSPDGKAVLSGGGDGCLRLHDLDKGEERRRFVIDKQPQAPGEAEYQVRSLVLATDGGTAASWSAKSLREPALFQVWDLATGEALVRRADPWVRRSNPWGSGARLFSPDAKLVLSCLATTAGGDAMPAVMASSGTPAHFGPCTVDLRDVATGRPILPLPQPDTYGYVQAFAPDGRTLVTATGKMPETEAVPSDHHALHLWELATGKERLTIAPGETGREYRFEQVAFAPDGRALATARADGTLQLWDLATGAALLSRAGYCARVTCLALSPDSRVLASGHADGTILLWELTSGRRAAGRPAAKPDAGQLDRWWGDLAGEDARKAGAAIDGLCAVPERTVTLLRDRLRPAPAVPADEIRRRIADLDSDAFERREAASADLAALGDQARAAMQAVLQANPSVELRRRAETLLADSGIARSAETRRALRAVEMLERVGSPEARQILEALGQGAPDARQTREVKAALARLSRR